MQAWQEVVLGGRLHTFLQKCIFIICVVSRHLSETTFIALIVTDEPSSFWPFSDLFFKETNHAWFSSSETQIEAVWKKRSRAALIAFPRWAVAKFEKSGRSKNLDMELLQFSLRRWKSFPFFRFFSQRWLSCIFMGLKGSWVCITAFP